MPEPRAKPKPATHLEITIRYTVPAEQANIGGILLGLEQGFGGDPGGRAEIPGGGKAELVKVKTVPAPE
jgi:hypothetical protein